MHEDSPEKIFSLRESRVVAVLPGWKRVLEAANPSFRIHFITSVEGSTAIEKLIDDDAHAPDIYSVVICDFAWFEARAEHLYWVEFECSNSCILILLLEFFLIDCKPEIRQVNIPIEANHDVFRLQIPVDYSLLMKLL